MTDMACPKASRAAVRRTSVRRPLTVLPTLAAALVVAVIVSLAIGKYPIGVSGVLRFLAAAAGLDEVQAERYAVMRNIIVDIRLPRILAAVLVGAALSSSGAAFQAVFRNPLVSPGLLGVLSGASFGAALGILFGASWGGVQALAFVMGLLAVGLGVAVAVLFRGAPLILLVLGGIISSALFASLLSIVKYVADPIDQLPDIIYWLMGNLAQSDLAQVGWLAPPMLGGIALLALFGQALDALAMGDDEARSLGVPVSAVRYAVIGAATLTSAITVSMAGIIGWVGLIIPHIVRLLVGPRNRVLIPASALLGALFLTLTDIIARTVANTEVPIGILTELLGAPAFLLVLGRACRGWNER